MTFWGYTKNMNCMFPLNIMKWKWKLNKIKLKLNKQKLTTKNKTELNVKKNCESKN